MKENFYEDTMLLLEMIKDKRHKENREKKVSSIYQFFNLCFFLHRRQRSGPWLWNKSREKRFMKVNHTKADEKNLTQPVY